MATTQNETIIRRAIMAELRRAGWFTFYVYQGLGSYKGISDLIALRDGKTAFIEVKTETGKQSPEQVQFQKDCEAHGGLYILARSTDDVQELLNSTPLF